MTCSTKCLATLALSIFCTTGVPLAASPFQNGNFEANAPLGSSPDFITTPTGWVKTDPTGAGLFLQNYSTFGLPTLNGDGPTAFGFGGNGTLTGTLAQTFDTMAGTQYTVSFEYLIQQQTTIPESFQVDAFNGVNTLATTQFLHFTNTGWIFGSLNFTATGPQSTLQFTDLSGAQDPQNAGVNWALDSVSLTGVATSGVPEPATWGLVGCAFAALFGYRARRANDPAARPE